jgi:hypothetical protein
MFIFGCGLGQKLVGEEKLKTNVADLGEMLLIDRTIRWVEWWWRW